VHPVSQLVSDTGARLVRGPAGERLRTGLLVLSFALLLVVGLSLPHAAASDLGDRGWAPGTLLPFSLAPAAVTAAMWTAYTLGALALVLSLLRRDGELPRPVVAVLAVAAALTTPFGSGDHVSYAAYGRILDLGDNPWLESPEGWRGGTDPVVSRVEAPWTEEPSVYGPFATLVHGLTSQGGGDNLRETVWLWQLVVIASWLAVRWCLRSLLPGREARIDALWTANPLVFSVGLLGAHVDLLASALGVASVWAAHRWVGAGGAVLAGTFAALALSSKFTYAVFLLALLLALGVRRLGRSAAVVGAAVVVTGALHVWAGPHVYDQVGRSARAVSLASPWRWLLEVSGGGVDVRLRISALAALTAIIFALCLLRLVRPAGGLDGRRDPGPAALGWVVVLAGGYTLAASYSLPWYDLMVWSALPVGAVGAVDTVLLARLWVMAMAYTPGRVLGMTPGVEDVTMTVRTRLAPLVLLLAWAWLVRTAWRDGSWPRRGGRPGGSGPRR
jgi:hypothetical protein